MPEKPLLVTVPVASDPKVEKKLAKEAAKEKKVQDKKDEKDAKADTKRKNEEDEATKGSKVKKEGVLETVAHVAEDVEKAAEQFVDAFAGGDMENHDEL